MVVCWTLSSRCRADCLDSRVCGLYYWIEPKNAIEGLGAVFDRIIKRSPALKQHLEKHPRLFLEPAMRDSDSTSAAEQEYDVELEASRYSANCPRPIYQPNVQIQDDEADMSSIISRSRLSKRRLDWEMGLKKKKCTFERRANDHLSDEQDVPGLERNLGKHEIESFRNVYVLSVPAVATDKFLKDVYSIKNILTEAKRALLQSIDVDYRNDRSDFIRTLEDITLELQHLLFEIQRIDDWHEFLTSLLSQP